jgi:hypothetical protein
MVILIIKVELPQLLYNSRFVLHMVTLWYVYLNQYLISLFIHLKFAHQKWAQPYDLHAI